MVLRGMGRIGLVELALQSWHPGVTRMVVGRRRFSIGGSLAEDPASGPGHAQKHARDDLPAAAWISAALALAIIFD
jgi:hypothetical protein